MSIGMPVYNGERYLRESLGSLLAQTHRELEVVISDNASEDATAAICQEYVRNDGRVRYVRNSENLGAARNYNRVFELATGALFKWAAADDLCEPTFVEQCVATLDRRPEVILAYPKTTLIDEDGAVLPFDEDALCLDSPHVVDRFPALLDPLKMCHNPHMGVARRSALARTRLIRSHLAADRCFIAELSLYGPFAQVPERLFRRRKHRASTGTSLADVSFFDPSRQPRFVLPEWRVCAEHLVSILRSPLRWRLKAQLMGAVFSWAIRNRRHFKDNLAVAVDDLVRHRRAKLRASRAISDHVRGRGR